MNKRAFLIFMFILLISAGIISCSKKQADEIIPDQVPATETPGAGVVYTGAVQDLITTKCGGCHAAGKQAAAIWTFAGYGSVTANSARIKQAVLVSKTMPLGGSLTSAELKLLQDWFNNGMKQ